MLRVTVRVRFIAALLYLVDERKDYLRGNHVVFRADCVLVTLVMFRFLHAEVREEKYCKVIVGGFMDFSHDCCFVLPSAAGPRTEKMNHFP